MELFIVTALTIYLFTVIIRPHWGIYLILAFLPSYQIRFIVLGVPTTFLEWLIVILTAVTIIRLGVLGIKNHSLPLKNFPRLKWFWIIVLIFFIASVAAVAVAPATSKALGIFKAYVFEGIVFALLALILLDSREKLFNAFRALGWLVAILGAFGIYQYFTLSHLPPAWWGPGVEPRRVVSVFSYPNAAALLVTPILAFFASFLIFWKQDNGFFSKKFLVTVVGLGSILVGLTFSRGAWLGMGAAMLTLLFFTKHKKILLSFLVASVIIALVIPTSHDRLLPMFTGTDPAGLERVKLWQGAGEIILNQPITGAGLMGYRAQYEIVRQSPTDNILNYPHNFFLNFWTETGLFGLLSIIALLIWIFWRGKKLYQANEEHRPVLLALLAAWVALLVHGQVDVPFFKNDLAILFWFLLIAVPTILTYSAVKDDQSRGL